FGSGFDGRSGRVGVRGGRSYSADGQCLAVLRAYREHLMSPEDAFLQRNWPAIRKATEYLLKHDGDDDGLMDNEQPCIFDRSLFGANSYLGPLYLAALRAGEEMAKRCKDKALAGRCRAVFESGSKLGMERLFNGEYFIQEITWKKYRKYQYGLGCLSAQLFGQAWAHQVGLGYLYPRGATRKASASVYRYNWTPDVHLYNSIYKPYRTFARAGEAGLFNCTWPKSKYWRTGVNYKNEVWVGTEYQVASLLLAEGMVAEGLGVVRGIHERYDGKKHNPFNEVGHGEHYARALASWGCLIAAEGFEYDGPAGRMAFAPRLAPETFRGPFTGAEGWGTLAQVRGAETQQNGITVRWGRLRLTEVDLHLPSGWERGKTTASLKGRPVAVRVERGEGGRRAVHFTRPLLLEAGDGLVLITKK
ncbi:MAG: GH116 family glycosyl hydrolase, partial [Planctomycetota bacterium]